MCPMSKVYPSGGDFATASAPMVPPAPPRFSTTTGWPSASESLCAMGRAKMSVDPPGGNGTTSFSGFEGQACAALHGEASAMTAAASHFGREVIAVLCNG